MAKQKESQNIEWKQSWRDDWLKWVCGFANAQGGRLSIGKNDAGEVIGLKNAKKLSEDLPNKIRDKLGLIPQVNLLQKNNKHYIEIVVEPSNVPISHGGAYYIRSAAVNQELKGQALTDFLLRKMGVTWDRVVMPKATLKDIDSASVRQYKMDAATAGRVDIGSLTVEKTLKKLRLITKDGVTNAALVLFGKDPAAFFPNHFVKIGRFGDSVVDMRFQEVCEGNLIQLLSGVIEMLDKKFLVKPVRFEGIKRLEELEYPLAALREMLLNALVHRNYLGSMVQIKVMDNKLSIWNPGLLPEELTVKSLFKFHESVPRNPLIAEVCYKAGYIDSWGRGFERILEACKKAEIKNPKVVERNGGIAVELEKSAVKSVVKSAVKSVDKIIILISHNPQISVGKIAKELNLTKSAVEKQLAKLKRLGKIKRIGPNKGGHWEVKQ